MVAHIAHFLRLAACAKLAADRPKDFGDLCVGLTSNVRVRHHMYSIMHRSCGPSLLTGGMWTKCRLHLAGLASDNLCTRCGEAPEDLLHRLWRCSANEPFRAARIPNLALVDGLPIGIPMSLARCAVVPHGCSFNADVLVSILDYLWLCAEDATSCLARSYRNLSHRMPWDPRSPTVDTMISRSLHCVFARPVQPTERPKTFFFPRLPQVMTPSVAHSEPPVGGFSFSTDGSFAHQDDGPDICGWGFVVIDQ